MLKTIPAYIQIFFWVLQVVFIPDSVRLYKAGQQESSYQNYTKVYFNPAELKGPERLCNVFGSVLASYFGGGDPATDVYSWQIFSPSNQLIFSGSGGGGFQTINFTFSQNGPHKILLKVFRGGIQIGDFEKIIELIAGPEVTLEETYEICSNQEIELQAIHPSSDNFSKYTFSWTDENGTEIGKENTQKITKTGTYEVKFFFTNSLGLPECLTTAKTKITLFQPFTITPSSSSICVGQTISFSSTPNTLGNWFLQKKGSPKIAPLGPGTGKFLGSGNFQDGFGEYEIILKTTNPSNPDCSSEARATIRFNVEPQVKVDTTQSASDCISADGKLVLEAMTDLSLIQIENKNISLGPFKAGELIEIPNLESGAYTIDLFLEGCSNSLGAIVPLEVIPPSLEYEILDVKGESCTETGKINGSFNIKLQNGPLEGSYQLFNSKGDLILKNALPEQDEFEISIGGGKYLFEILDKDSCNFPKREEIEIPSKFQTFFLVPEELNVCQSLDFIPQTSQPLTFTLTYPDGKKETKPKGQPFLLTQKGDYSILGVLENQTEICPRSATFKVNLIDPIDYEPKLIDQDCFGNRTYKADIKDADPTTVKFQWFNEKNELVGTGQLLNPVSFGKFKLDVQPINSTACPIPPKEFEIVNPVLSVDLSLSSTKLCELGPRAILDLSSTFPDEITDVEWRRYDANGTIEELPQFKNKYQVIVDQEGTYEAAVFSRIPEINKNCELGRKALMIDLIPERVEIQIPGDLSICDPYELTPTSPIPLEYTLTFPDGTVENKSSGQSFTLNQEGTYTLFGIDPNPNGPKCPQQKTFKVKVNPPVQFNPVFQTLNCDGSYRYQAKVDNYPADSVVYLWKDSFGNVAGTSSVLQTFTYGNFSLEVQPKGSIPCTSNPISFDIPVPILNIDVALSAEPLCPDQPNAALTVNTDFAQVSLIEWWFTDINNNRIQLTSETDKKEIAASQNGTYEVLVKNSFGCILGQDQLLVLRSTDQVRPELKEKYLICPNLQIGPNLNPGNFASYEWYFEGRLVSSDPIFKPLQLGAYDLFVQSQEGCVYQATFTTAEECDPKLRIPDAIQPENPDKQFLIYTNYLVDELELYIYNKWGNLIFHCKKTELIDQESTCVWDGTYRGEKVPAGTYVYRVNYKNIEKNIQKTESNSFLVID